MLRKACEICILLCLERTWERGCFLEYSIHGKELGSFLLRRWIKKISGFSVHTIPDLWRIQKFPLWRVDSKSYGFVCRIHRIRVDGSLIRKEKKSGFKNIRIRVDGTSISPTLVDIHFRKYHIWNEKKR